MEFKFKIQQYQTDAVNAVVNVFEGQPHFKKNSTLVNNENVNQEYEYGNARIMLSAEDLLRNIKKIQQNCNIPMSDRLDTSIGSVSIDVEMETGTGKTYVYIKTMYELNKKYGWSKFIVVVPSVAIREGVKKSFEMTSDHFMECYHKRPRFFVYNSSNLTQIESFSNSPELSVMIINTQAFNAFREGVNNNVTRRIYSECDDFGSKKPIEVIKAANPILILDEPQRMEGKATTRALRHQFNPLFSINYSATHRKHHNTVYVLDALEAYNQKLVKKIEVKGFEEVNPLGVNGYLYLQELVVSSTESPKAKLEFEVSRPEGIKKVTKLFSEGDSIYNESGRLAQYENGYIITNINPSENFIALSNDTIIHAGEAIGDDISDEDKIRIQIKETIISHFEKEEKLFRRGIKTLSLFFVDKVEHYRKYDDEGNAILGDYGKIFEEEYAKQFKNSLKMTSDSLYRDYLRENCSNVQIVHNGYFSIDKEGYCVNGGDNDISAYDLILKNKERLLSFEEPTRFIFSHSALREGWDNPNIFQICTLKSTRNQILQHQEIGRGLRICVDKEGNRMDFESLGSSVFDINKLTVITSESYSTFVKSLQEEIRPNFADRPMHANVEYYTGKVVALPNGETHKITAVEAQIVIFYLIQKRYVDYSFNLTNEAKDVFYDGIIESFPPEIQNIKSGVIKLTRALFDSSILEDMICDGRRASIRENPLNENFYNAEFQELWNLINAKYIYEVNFRSEKLVENSVQALNRSLSVRRLQYVMRVGAQRNEIAYNEAIGNNFFVEERNAPIVFEKASISVKYDLVGEIARRTSLLRKTVVMILQGLSNEKFAMFQLNPEDFILKVSNEINSQKASILIDDISYKPTGEKYDSSIFTVSEERKDFLQAIECNKNVQKYVFPDGISVNSIEARFVRDLENSDAIEVYAKLPRSFKIPTPVGNYSPDWAIAFRRGTVRHIFFVAETKGSLNSLDLRGFEKAKISCAEILFNEINNSNVVYHQVVTYQDLYNYAVQQ